MTPWAAVPVARAAATRRAHRDVLDLRSTFGGTPAQRREHMLAPSAFLGIVILPVASAADALPGFVAVNLTTDTERFSTSIAVGLIVKKQARPAAMLQIRASDLPWLEETKRQDQTAERTSYRNVTSTELLSAAVTMGAAQAAVLFNSSEMHALSTVVTLCGIHRALALTDPAEAAQLKLPVAFDTRGKWSDSVAASQYAVRELLPACSRKALVLQAPHVFLGGYLADLVVAGYGADPRPLFAVWPESPYSNPNLPTLCNRSTPQWELFTDLVEGSTAAAHDWEGPGEAGLKMPTMIGYHDKGPGAWAESINLCTEHHRTISLVGDLASNLAFHSRAVPVAMLTQHPPQPAGAYNSNKTYVAIVVSDGDNMQIDQCRINDIQLSGIGWRADACRKPGAVCPPLAWTMSNRMAELAPVILRWWYRRATPADSFLLGPSGYGYVYPGLMARTSQTAFAEATGNAARALGMTGYVHWDWLGDFDIGIGTNGTDALPFLEDVAKTSLEVVFVATVPDVIKPDLPDLIGDTLAIAKPTSAITEGLGTWAPDDANAASGCGTCPLPGESLPHGCTECVQPKPTSQEVARKLLAIPKGEITYMYKIWSVNYTAVEALGAALVGTHVQLVDHRELPQLIKAKVRHQAAVALRNSG